MTNKKLQQSVFSNVLNQSTDAMSNAAAGQNISSSFIKDAGDDADDDRSFDELVQSMEQSNMPSYDAKKMVAKPASKGAQQQSTKENTMIRGQATKQLRRAPTKNM